MKSQALFEKFFMEQKRVDKHAFINSFEIFFFNLF